MSLLQLLALGAKSHDSFDSHFPSTLENNVLIMKFRVYYFEVKNINNLRVNCHVAYDAHYKIAELKKVVMLV